MKPLSEIEPLFFGHSDPDPSSVMYNIDVLGYNIVLKVKYTIYMNVYKSTDA